MPTSIPGSKVVRKRKETGHLGIELGVKPRERGESIRATERKSITVIPIRGIMKRLTFMWFLAKLIVRKKKTPAVVEVAGTGVVGVYE